MAAYLEARHLAGKRGEMSVKEIDDIDLLPARPESSDRRTGSKGPRIDSQKSISSGPRF
jgi:hypothetical protein